MLGVIPAVSNSEIWIKKIKEERERFNRLKENVSLISGIHTPFPIYLFNPHTLYLMNKIKLTYRYIVS